MRIASHIAVASRDLGHKCSEKERQMHDAMLLTIIFKATHEDSVPRLRIPSLARFHGLISPVSRKSPWKHFGFEKVKLERSADDFWTWILGVNFFFWGGEALEIRGKNSLSEFAEKFAGNFPGFRWTNFKEFTPTQKDPAELKILRDKVKLLRVVFSQVPLIYYAVNASLEGEMPVKPRKWCLHIEGGSR